MLPRPRPSVVTRRLFPVVTRRVTQPPIHIRPALAYSYSSLRRPRQQGNTAAAAASLTFASRHGLH